MSAEIVNLRKERKRRERAAKSAAADQNRLTHGPSKPERTDTGRAAESATRRLDGHRLDREARRAATIKPAAVVTPLKTTRPAPADDEDGPAE